MWDYTSFKSKFFLFEYVLVNNINNILEFHYVEII
jgi:hypothetical protein